MEDTAAEAAMPDGAVFCKSCDAVVDEVEEFGGALMCAACGTVLEEAGLVSHRDRPQTEVVPAEGFGVVVRHDDSGAVAGERKQPPAGRLAAGAPRTSRGGSAFRRSALGAASGGGLQARPAGR
jgi:hypothetical protein